MKRVLLFFGYFALGHAIASPAFQLGARQDSSSSTSATLTTATSTTTNTANTASNSSTTASLSTSSSSSSIASSAVQAQVTWALGTPEYEAAYQLALQATQDYDDSTTSSSSSSMGKSSGGSSIGGASGGGGSGSGGGGTSSSSGSSDEVASYTSEYPYVACPNASETGALGNDAITKAKALVAQMTTAEKIIVITSSSVSTADTGISSLNYSGYSTSDGAYGVADATGVSGWLSSINLASTWNRSLIYQVGRGMASEFRAKGLGAQGPFLNLYNAPLAGRSKESYGADPYVSGESASQIFRAFKDGNTISVGKHLIANDWETNRETVNKTMGQRTLQEVYLRPWSKAIKAGMNGAMCAMNMYNGSWSCSNAALLNGEIKARLNFQGYITPDVDAQKSVETAAMNGLDSGTWTGLSAAVTNGSFSAERLDDMAVRVVGAWYATAQDTDPMANSSLVTDVNVQTNHSTLITQAGTQSMVLLKNVNNTLPLKKPSGIALIGNDASAPERGPNGFDNGSFLTSNFSVSGHFAGQGEGCPTFPWLISPLEAISYRARQDNTAVTWSINNTDFAWMAAEALGVTPYGSVAASSSTVAASFSATVGPVDVCIVFGNMVAGEGFDRDTWSMDSNVQSAIWLTAENCNNTIVVMNTVGSVDVEAWADHPNITAIIWAGLPGQNSGESLVNLLYGDDSPSGKLPFTWGHNLTDYPYQINSSQETVDYDADFSGLLIDYRYFDYYNITPRYAFGFGLSYTTFEYGDNASVEKASSGSNDSSRSRSQQQMSRRDSATTIAATTTSSTTSTAATATVTEAIPTVQANLDDEAYTVSFTLTNSGTTPACEVSQLYLGYTTTEYGMQPPRVLRGFEKTCLEADSAATVSFTLANSDVYVWSVFDDDWVEPNGTINYFIGSSSRDLRINGTLS